MECTWIENIEDFAKIKNKWDKALIDADLDNPFLLSDFIICWWNQYQENKKLKILVIKSNEEIIGGIPLYLEQKGLLKQLLYIGDSAANFTEPFSLQNVQNTFNFMLEEIFRQKWWDTFILIRIRNYSKAEYSLSESYRNYQKNILIKNGTLNASIELDKSIGEIIESLPKRLRRYLRSCTKTAAEYGDVQLSEIPHDELEEYFKLYVKFSIDAYEKRGRLSAFHDERQSIFFLNLLTELSGKNLLDAHVLKFGQENVAISFGYRFGKGFKWILTTYNPEFDDLRPGHLLIQELLRYAIQNNDPYFDMYSGGEKFYKQQWCNRFDPLFKFSIFNNSMIGKIAKFGYIIKNKFGNNI